MQIITTYAKIKTTMMSQINIFNMAMSDMVNIKLDG